MDLAVFFKVTISLLFVVTLMYFLLRIIQRYSNFGRVVNPSNNNIRIESILYVDDNAKIVSLRQFKTNYILAVGKNNIVLIDKYADIE